MSPTVQTLLMGAILALGFWGVSLLKPWPKRTLFLVYGAVWLTYCLWHLSVGMGHGFTFVQELPFLLINFIIPAVLAWVMLFKVKTNSST